MGLFFRKYYFRFNSLFNQKFRLNFQAAAMAQWESSSLPCGGTVDRISLPPKYFFENKTQVKASTKSLTEQSAKKFLPNQSEIFCHFSSKLNKDINEISAWVTWVDMELRTTSHGSPFCPRALPGPWAKREPLGGSPQFHIRPRHPCRNYPFLLF